MKFIFKLLVLPLQILLARKNFTAIRSGFVSIIPVLVVGSFALLLSKVVFSSDGLLADLFDVDSSNPTGIWETFSKYIEPALLNIWWGTYAIIAVLITFAIGYNLAKLYKVDALSGGLVALTSFFIATPHTITNMISGVKGEYLSASGIFTGILVAIISVQIFKMLMKTKIAINIPENLPESALRIRGIFPALIVLSIFGAIPVILNSNGLENLHEFVYTYVTKPTISVSQGKWFAIGIAIAASAVWFVGINALAFLSPVLDGVYRTTLAENITAYEASESIPHIFTSAFFSSFVFVGGVGAILALVFAILIKSKRKDYKSIAKVGLVPAIFNINEPVMLGLPVVLNKRLLIPFIITPGILTLIAYYFTHAGIIPYTVAEVSYVTPPVISAYISTGADGLKSIFAALVAILNIFVATLIYMPFVKKIK